MPLSLQQRSAYVGSVLGTGGRVVRLDSLADSLLRSMESAAATVSESLFEPVIRLGVTGLARSGKTVFITGLVANLLDRGRMPQLRAAAEGAIRAAWLHPQPDLTLPRFDFETHMAALTGPEPHWPESTRSISELRLSFRVQPGGLLGSMSGPRRVHLDIVDYPGEWLLDLALLDSDFATWAAESLKRMAGRPGADAFLAKAAAVDAAGPHDETLARELADAFAAALQSARRAGFSDCTPGRFLLPGDLAGAPVVTFAPLHAPAAAVRRGSLWREMERRYEGYKREVVRPFFREHFTRIDRQVVLVDALGAIHSGPAAVADMRRVLAEVLAAFRPGRNAWLMRLLAGRRVERILFAATKADRLHHSQHGRLTAIMEAMLREARDRAAFAGAATEAMALSAWRTTIEETRDHNGRRLECVRGVSRDTGREAAFWAGDLPENPMELLSAAGSGEWLAGDYGAMEFVPPGFSPRPGEGPPHIRLDRAAEFLFGDRLR